MTILIIHSRPARALARALALTLGARTQETAPAPPTDKHRPRDQYGKKGAR